MNDKELWQQKLIMLLHDPPGKPFFLQRGAGGHKKVAGELFQRIAGKPLKFAKGDPDWAAAGADRPIVSPPTRTAGVSPISVDWVSHPVVTHPLASGDARPTCLDFGAADRRRSRAAIRALAEELIERYPDEMGGGEEAQKALESLPLWDDAQRLKEACLWLWRRWPDSAPEGLGQTLWRCQPADSRAPDHSLWDHTRVTSALAFTTGRKQEGARMPWLLAFSIGPVQRFIAQSRTGTDLWTSSMLFSDLIWHAMLPIVEQYGPEAIVYPDLRKNPRADLWLVEQDAKRGWHVLDAEEDPCSYAGIFPNTFIALVPRGGEGALVPLPLPELAHKARESVRKRWKDLAELAHRYWLEQGREQHLDLSAFSEVWQRQHEKDVLFTIWSAAAWPGVEKVKDAEALAIRNALPAQPPAPPRKPEDEQAVMAWQERHRPWIDPKDFARYAQARAVYARTNLDTHQMQRGFDYALIHHALTTRHAIRKAEASGALLVEERGEKCSLCGEREALGPPRDGRHDTVDEQRQGVREFWHKLDPNSHGGSERLCAVCAMKRVLIRAGLGDDGQPVGLTRAWAGARTDMKKVRDEDGKLRVPFPSTATLAAQAYLCKVASHHEVRAEVEEVVRAAEQADLPRTSFVRALRSLAETGLHRGSIGRRFLEYEAEMTAFPEVIASAMRQAKAKSPHSDVRDKHGNIISPEKLQALYEAVSALRDAAKEAGIKAPGTQVAVIAVDGDSIRKVLLGTNEIGARWQDVLHPKVVEAVKGNERTEAAVWPQLLEQRRLMGPSTHAFVNRVLASFAHVIVPWVVEREFLGRLVYAGGDDVLALAPAGEALPIVARLSQLYQAAWIVDMQSGEEPWSWREKDAPISAGSARARFVIPELSQDGTSIPVPEQGEILPMMGEGQTLSAGIALGHYKTPLGGLIRAAWDERDSAKELPGKNAFSVRRLSRGGEKAVLRMPFLAYGHVEQTIEAFHEKELAARLPYKLREVEQAVFAAWRHEEDKDKSAAEARVCNFARSLFEDQAGRDHAGAFDVWWAGLEAARRGSHDCDKPDEHREHAGSEAGLAVCRYLGALARGQQEEER